jgi:hypothetical protein
VWMMNRSSRLEEPIVYRPDLGNLHSVLIGHQSPVNVVRHGRITWHKACSEQITDGHLYESANLESRISNYRMSIQRFMETDDTKPQDDGSIHGENDHLWPKDGNTGWDSGR